MYGKSLAAKTGAIRKQAIRKQTTREQAIRERAAPCLSQPVQRRFTVTDQEGRVIVRARQPSLPRIAPRLVLGSRLGSRLGIELGSRLGIALGIALGLAGSGPVAAQTPLPEDSPPGASRPLFQQSPQAKSTATEEVSLQDGKQRFKGLFLEAEGETREGALLILPDLDRGPDERKVLQPLRLHLPTQGWATLTLELPGSLSPFTEESYGKLIVANRRRIRLGFHHLLQRGFERIVVIGHGFGALMAVSWASVDKENLPEGLIVLNLTPYHPPGGEGPMLQHLQKIRVPILDLYSGKSHARVLRYSVARKRAGQLSGNVMYRQLLLEHANHDFTPYTEAMLRVVRNWLKHLHLERERYQQEHQQEPRPQAPPPQPEAPGAPTALPGTRPT